MLAMFTCVICKRCRERHMEMSCKPHDRLWQRTALWMREIAANAQQRIQRMYDAVLLDVR